MTARWPQPPPTRRDPHGFAVGVLNLEALEKRGLRLQQWRWHYGDVADRETPFEEHRVLAGRFMTLEGEIDGWFPGDHKGCLCTPEPVLRVVGT